MSDSPGSEDQPPPMTPAERRAAKIRKAAPAQPQTTWSPRPPGPPQPAQRPPGPGIHPTGPPASSPGPASTDREEPGSGPPAENDVHAGSHVHPPDQQDSGAGGLGDRDEEVASGLPAKEEAPGGVDEIAAAVDEVERAVLDDLDRLQSERNDYLDQLQRTRADFDNYRKRMLKQQTENSERAAEALAEKLFEVLDTFDAAVQHGAGFEQGHLQLVAVLEKQGLEKIDPTGQAFDPTEADAVAHEDGDGGPVVAAVLRPGYRWKGRVVRPAMVKVRG